MKLKVGAVHDIDWDGNSSVKVVAIRDGQVCVKRIGPNGITLESVEDYIEIPIGEFEKEITGEGA